MSEPRARRKPLSELDHEVLQRLSHSVRLLMQESDPPAVPAVVARAAGISMGSLQGILKPRGQMPGLRTLLRLVQHFDLDGVGCLTDGLLGPVTDAAQ